MDIRVPPAYNPGVTKFTYPWQECVQDAFLAPPTSLAIKIAIAERAIAARLVHSDLVEAEHLAIRDALSTLRVLLKETQRDDEVQNKEIA